MLQYTGHLLLQSLSRICCVIKSLANVSILEKWLEDVHTDKVVVIADMTTTSSQQFRNSSSLNFKKGKHWLKTIGWWGKLPLRSHDLMCNWKSFDRSSRYFRFLWKRSVAPVITVRSSKNQCCTVGATPCWPLRAKSMIHLSCSAEHWD